MPRWVSSTRLHKVAVRCDGSQVTRKCTLLPFFDETGQVRRVMVVSEDSEDILFFDPSDVSVRIPWFGSLSIVTSFSSLRVLDYEDLDPLTRLWHFDPWWLLTTPENLQGGRALRLKPTNCVDFTFSPGSVSRVWYSRDLTRIAYVEHKAGGEASVVRFKSELLPQRTEESASAIDKRLPCEWRLVPFWM